MTEENEVVDLNVGGTIYTATRKILLKDSRSRLYDWFKPDRQENDGLCKDNRGFYFIDRDGQLFRFILDYLRNEKLLLPDGFSERQRLLCEAQYFKLQGLIESIFPGAGGLRITDRDSFSNSAASPGSGTPGYITIGYQGSFSFGPQGLAGDVNFRKINRILVSGRVSLCREVFGDTLNEGRDPDRGHQNDRDRYTSRYYLKHNLIECAFDMLTECGFKLITSCASGTSGPTGDPKPGSNTEEDRWAHYNEFVFLRCP